MTFIVYFGSDFLLFLHPDVCPGGGALPEPPSPGGVASRRWSSLKTSARSAAASDSRERAKSLPTDGALPTCLRGGGVASGPGTGTRDGHAGNPPLGSGFFLKLFVCGS